MLRRSMNIMALAALLVAVSPLLAENVDENQSINLNVNEIVLVDDRSDFENADPTKKPTKSIADDVIESVDAVVADLSEDMREKIRTAIRENETLKRADEHLGAVDRQMRSVSRMFVIGPDGKKAAWHPAPLLFDFAGIPKLDGFDSGRLEFIGPGTLPLNSRETRERIEEMRAEVEKKIEARNQELQKATASMADDIAPDASHIVASGRVVIIGPNGDKQEFRVGNKDGDFKSYKESLKQLENTKGVPKGIAETLQNAFENGHRDGVRWMQGDRSFTLSADEIRFNADTKTDETSDKPALVDALNEKLDQLLERLDAIETKVDALTP